MADRAQGYKYQLGVTAYLASLLSKDITVLDYHIFYEIKELEPFDDIVLTVQYNDSEDLCLYLIQVKSGRVKLDVDNYLKEYEQIMDEKRWKCLANVGKMSEEDIQFWYFACQKFRPQPISFQKGDNLEIRRRTFVSNRPIINRNVYELYSTNHEIATKYKGFFRNFYVFLEQVDTNTITTRLKGMWALNDAGQVTEYLDKYFNKNKRGSLSKTDFEHELLRIRLWDSIVKPTKITSYQKESALAWNDLTLSYNVTIVKNEADIETCLFGCISRSIEEKITAEQWNACIDNDGKLSKEIKDEFSTSFIKPETLKDLLTYYWTCGKIPLVLKSDSGLPQLEDFLNLNQHYIIIDPDPDRRYREMESYNLTAIKNLGSRKAVALLESVSVSMQGRQPTSFYTVINGNELLMQTLTCSDILKLMEPRQVYISEDCLEDHNYRLFIIEKSQPGPINYEDYEPNGDNICIYCNLDGSTEIYKKLKGDITFRNYRIYRLRLENDKLKLMHNKTPLDNDSSYDPGTFGEDECVQGLESFQIDQYGKNVYSISEGHAVPIIGEVTKMNCLKYLQRYMRKRTTDNSEPGGNEAASSTTEFSETTFPDKDFFKEIDSRICVVTGEAGVGKTTFLQQLVRNYNPHYYVLFHNLVKFQVNMREKTQKLVKDPLNFLWNRQGPLSCDHFLRILRQGRSRLILVLDSLDEVIPTCKDEVLELIRKLNDEACLEKIIIGSRLMTVALLTNLFEIKVAKIEMFSIKYNGDYLNNWNLDKNVLEKVPTEFLTNPLYLDMLRTMSQTSNIDLSVLSRWTLYNRIVDLKIERYSRRTKYNFDLSEKKHILQFHWKSALKYMFGNNSVTRKFAQQDQVQFANSVRLGMIKYYDVNKHPVFIHHTFAEFFVMQWLSETTDQKSKEIIYKIILTSSFRCLLDIYCEQFPLHKALLDAGYMDSAIHKAIEKLYRDNKEVLIQTDVIGRTALDIIASDYQRNTNRCIETIIRYMHEEGYNLYSRDNLLHWTWIDYCEYVSKSYITTVPHEFCATHEAYWSYYASSRTSISVDPFTIYVSYQMAVNYFLPNILDKLLLILYRGNKDFISFHNVCLSSEIAIAKLPKYFELDHFGLKPLHLAIIYSNINIVRACIKRGDKINVTDYLGCTPLYYSVLKQNREIVKLLLDKSAGKLDWGEESKFTIFQLSLRLENKDITKMLIDVVDVKKFGSVWLCDAVLVGDIEVIALLLKRQIDPNMGRGRDRDKYFEDEILCRQALKAIMQYCDSDYSISIQSLDEYLSMADAVRKVTEAYSRASYLPLITAVHARRTDIVHLLLKKGVNINTPNMCSYYAHTSERVITECTPLRCAIESWNIDMVELLLQYGAGANHIDRYGMTPLKIAINNNVVIYKDIDDHICKAWGNFENRLYDTHDIFLVVYQNRMTFSLTESLILDRRLQMIEVLLRYGADVNIAGERDLTPLEVALESQNWRIVEMLLSNGANPKNMKKWNFTDILAVLPVESVEIVELLLKNRADPNFKTVNDVTPLYVAARRKNADIVRLLFEYGASADVITSTHALLAKARRNADIDAITCLVDLDDVRLVGPIYERAYSVQVLNLLQAVENQANINLATVIETTYNDNDEKGTNTLLLRAADLENPNGKRYLNAVLQLRKPDIDKILLRSLRERGLRPDEFVVYAAEHKSKAMIEILARNGQSANSMVEFGLTVLTSVIYSRNISVVKFLLENQADINLADKCGNTPLMAAIRCSETSMIEMLLEHKAIVNSEEICGLTPLIMAIIKNNRTGFHFLLESGADINFTCKSGLTPLYAAIVKGYTKIIKILFLHCVNTDIETCGNRLLFKAITLGHTEVVDLLFYQPYTPCLSKDYRIVKIILRNLAYVNSVDEFGKTPLHLATELGNCDVVEKLLDWKADPNGVDMQGRTALHYAFQMNRKDIAEKLMQNSADVNIKDNHNFTPFDYDRTNENSAIVEN